MANGAQTFINELTFRKALHDDVAAIVALVNSAYRGDSSRAGWTTEADILGGQRTDAEEIAQSIAEAGSEFLLCMHDGETIGSVHLLRQDAQTAYLGMLVIKPGLQGRGLGSRLMDEAERFLMEQWSVSRLQMQVITLREELIAFYERRGFSRTGEFKPFPESEPRFGLPKVMGLKFEVLEKGLS
ncbi:MAG: GNAT family N-acetyltransferase [Gammaproteobacteria bacterium]|nr:GNAT family N-acetyltransferase [Sideroxydans sp.]MBU3903741.1 GNAT family N-acetyltransferase [Gammaproteobacteria bacterium]MBU4150478.1 GNAT family N-acetyltransferase [Gammaproteobacteria bacterium]